MKFRIFTLAIALASVNVATAQITLPSPSPAGSVSAKVGLVDVQIDYSRPKMKGRQIFGAGDDYLVPFDKLWRTGANSGSVLTTSGDLKVAGNELPAGEYLLLTIPGADSWTVIFYKDKSIGGNMSAHKEENEQFRVSVKPGKRTEAVEALTFNIADISEDNTTAAIELAWEHTSVKVPVLADYDEEVMKQIEASTKVNVRNYLAAANYYYNTGRDLDQAIAWIDLYLAAGNEGQFWNTHLKAQMQAKNGDKKGALATAEASLAMAKKAEGGDFGYIKRNEDLIASLK